MERKCEFVRELFSRYLMKCFFLIINQIAAHSSLSTLNLDDSMAFHNHTLAFPVSGQNERCAGTPLTWRGVRGGAGRDRLDWATRGFRISASLANDAT